MKQTIIQAILEHRLIAILRGIPEEKLIPVAQALHDGGIRLLEITYSADGHIHDEVTAANIQHLAEHFRGAMHIGAGTVLTPEQVALTAQADGQFIISPDTNPAVIAETNRLGLVSIPGALTPSEITAAHRLGADFVKLFPVTGLGPDYIKAIRAPLTHVRLLAVGGIDEANMSAYLAAGVCGFGIGSSLTDKMLIKNSDYAGLTVLAKAYTEVASHG